MSSIRNMSLYSESVRCFYIYVNSTNAEQSSSESCQMTDLKFCRGQAVIIEKSLRLLGHFSIIQVTQHITRIKIFL